ncbi:MAG: retropepsin-like domain-containing protein [Deltaproteobacteria bacterium]|nr:retropepsin-like domain-containing protein [Deltaproteobacteria bacterium]
MRPILRLSTLFLGATLLAAPPARAQDQPQTAPTLGDAARDLWRRLPDSVKAQAKAKLVELIMTFGGVRQAAPPPPPPQTAKEKAAAEKARKAELAKLKKLEQQRKAEEAKRAKAEKAAQAKAEREAKAAAAKAAKEGKAPPPEPVVKSAPAPQPAVPTESLHETAVHLERKGSSYYVGAKLNDQVEVSYLYDTGASITTVDKATLDKLGVQIPPNAATIRTSTANGVVEVPLIVLDTIDVGGARVTGGFTVSQCEPCSDGRKIGLLGLNFSRRYLTTLDESAKKLRLVPRVDALDHRFDVEPFLQYQGVKGSMRSGAFYVSGTVYNRAPRTANNVKVVAILVDSKEKEIGRVHGRIGTIPAGGTTQFQFHGRAPAFAKFYLELDGADW